MLPELGRLAKMACVALVLDPSYLVEGLLRTRTWAEYEVRLGLADTSKAHIIYLYIFKSSNKS